jgi:methionyl-tRNA synthetase
VELPKSVLIVPMQPTPNGRLHVGHGAGTYPARRVWSRLGYAGAPRKEAARTLASVFSSNDWPVIACSHAELSVAVRAPYAHIN